jgi:alpha-L-fucosidase 2
MNYWPAESTNLSELHEPLFRLIREIAANGTRTARDMYGRRGWVAHHNTSLWRDTFPVDGRASSAFWNMAAGWFSSHLWEHWLHTGNKTFLADEAYPIMKGAAEFCADWLTPDDNGQLITPVSTSPENTFRAPDGRSASITAGATMDHAIIRELFNRTIAAAELLGRDPDLVAELRDKLARLAPYRVGARGQLLEWRTDYKEPDPKHRPSPTSTASTPATRSPPTPRPNFSAPSPAPSSSAATKPPVGPWAGRSISGPACWTATTPTKSSKISSISWAPQRPR